MKISVAGLLLLAGCTSALQQQESYGVPGARYEIVRINGTFEPVVFVVDRDKVWTEAPAPCETGDPVPEGELRQPESTPPAKTPSAAPVPDDCR